MNLKSIFYPPVNVDQAPPLNSIYKVCDSVLNKLLFIEAVINFVPNFLHLHHLY
jgi:hypothetical protein